MDRKQRSRHHAEGNCLLAGIKALLKKKIRSGKKPRQGWLGGERERRLRQEIRGGRCSKEKQGE